LSYERRKMGSNLRFCLRRPVALPGTALQQRMIRHPFLTGSEPREGDVATVRTSPSLDALVPSWARHLPAATSRLAPSSLRRGGQRLDAFLGEPGMPLGDGQGPARHQLADQDLDLAAAAGQEVEVALRQCCRSLVAGVDRTAK